MSEHATVGTSQRVDVLAVMIDAGNTIAIRCGDDAAAPIRAARVAVAVALDALKQVAQDWTHPYDDGPFEDGEMPALDRARAALARCGAQP